MSSISLAHSNRFTTHSSASKAAGSANMDIDSAVTEIGKKRILRSSKTEAAPPARRRKVDPSTQSNPTIHRVVTRSLTKRKGDQIAPPQAQRKKLNIIEHDGIRYQGAVVWDDSKTKILHGTLADECQIEEDVYPAGSIVTFRESDGKLETVFLSKEAKIQELLCKANTSIHFLESGDFIATLAKDQKIGTLICKGGTEYVSYQDRGQSLTLADGVSQLVHGLFFQGGTKVIIGEKTTHGTLGLPFELDGFTYLSVIQPGNKISYISSADFKITLTQDTFIGGILFKQGTICSRINKEYSFTAVEGQEIDGIRCEKGSEIKIPFSTRDTPPIEYNDFEFTPEADSVISGINCKGKNEVTLNKEKKLLYATLAGTQEIRGVSFLDGSEIDLMEHNSNPANGILSRDQTINGIPCKGGELVSFSQDAETLQVDAAILSSHFEILGIPCMAGASFWRKRGASSIEDGFFMKVAADYEIDGFVFKNGSTLEIDPLRRNVKVSLSENHQIKGIPLAAGTTVITKSSRYPNCWEAILQADHFIGEVLCKKWEKVILNSFSQIYRRELLLRNS